MATQVVMYIDAIPYAIGVQGFVASPYALNVPEVYQLNDDSGNTSHTLDAPNEAERLSLIDPAFEYGLFIFHNIQVQVVGRPNNTDSDIVFKLGDNVVTAGTDGLDLFDHTSWPAFTVSSRMSPRYYKDWNDDFWTPDVLNNLFLWIELNNIDSGVGFGNDFQVFTVRVLLTIVYTATVTIYDPINPSVGVALAPLVKWNYIGNGEPQYQYRVKISTYLDAIDPDFDIETDPMEYDSGWVTSSASQHQVPHAVMDPGGYYVIWVQCNKNVNIMGATEFDLLPSVWQGSIIRANVPPVVNMTGPLTIVTTTRRPVITWSYTDEEAQPSLHHYVKIFDAATYLDVDFDADLSPTYREYDSDSPVFNGTDFQWKIDPSLPDGSYLVCIRATQYPDGITSEWDYTGLIIDTDFPRPDSPIVTVTNEPMSGRNVVHVQRAATGLQPEFYIILALEGQDLSTIRYLRGMGPTLQDVKPYAGSEITTDYDYEAKPWSEVNYAVSVYETTIDDPEPSVATFFATILQQNYCWLKDPLNPALNISFPVEDVWLGRSRAKSRTIRRPIGRSLPVTVRGKSQGESFPVTLIVLGNENYAKMMALVDSDRTLLFQTASSQWYVDIQSCDIVEHLTSHLHNEMEGTAWKFTLGFQEVAAP